MVIPSQSQLLELVTVEECDLQPEFVFENLIEYEGFSVPFVDAFSQFAVSVVASGPMGLAGIYPRGHQSTYQPCERLLMLWEERNGNLISVQRRGGRSLPWLYEESGCLLFPDNPVEIRGRHIFVNGRTLVSEFTFTNRGTAPVTIAPRFLGWAAVDEHISQSDLKQYGRVRGFPRATRLETVENGIRCGITTHGEMDMPGTAVLLKCLSHQLEVEIGESPFWGMGSRGSAGECPRDYLIGSGLVMEIPGRGTERIVFSTHFATCWHKRPTLKWPDPINAETSMEDLVEFARERFLRNIGWTVPSRCKGSLATWQWRARYGLLRTGLDGDDGEFAGSIASLCTSDGGGFSVSFFWDTLFSGAAIAEWNAEFARGAIRTAFVGQSQRDGSSAENKWNYSLKQKHYRQYPQAPVGTWAALLYHDATNDKDFLVEILPNLLENHRYWEAFGDRDGDGLAEWLWAGQTADDSPLWDSTSYRQPYVNGWLPPIASVSLNSFLYWDASNLMKLGERLGDDILVKRFAARRARIWEKFNEICHVPEEGRYWDYSHATGRHERIETFYMFMPLVAGMPVPEETARDLIENVLLNPGKFFGDIPFPSVAYDNPSYEPLGYWRGKAWPHIGYWLLGMLVRYGYVEEADIAAKRMLASWSLHPGIRENLATDPHLNEPRGQKDYNWGCAAFHLIADGRYRQA